MWGLGDNNKSCAHAHLNIHKHILNTSNKIFLPVSWNSISKAGIRPKLSTVVKTLHPVVNALHTKGRD